MCACVCRDLVRTSREALLRIVEAMDGSGEGAGSEAAGRRVQGAARGRARAAARLARRSGPSPPPVGPYSDHTADPYVDPGPMESRAHLPVSDDSSRQEHKGDSSRSKRVLSSSASESGLQRSVRDSSSGIVPQSQTQNQNQTHKSSAKSEGEGELSRQSVGKPRVSGEGREGEQDEGAGAGRLGAGAALAQCPGSSSPALQASLHSHVSVADSSRASLPSRAHSGDSEQPPESRSRELRRAQGSSAGSVSDELAKERRRVEEQERKFQEELARSKEV